MDTEEYSFFSEKFCKRATEALTHFPLTEGLCVNLCAIISSKLSEDNVPHSVCLGSLSCNGVKAFKYTKAFPRKPSGPVNWSGHAWIEFPKGYIGEPSLLRTARSLPAHSNIRNHLDKLDLLRSGILLFSPGDVKGSGLKYTKKKLLHKSAIPSLARGLIEMNSGRN